MHILKGHEIPKIPRRILTPIDTLKTWSSPMREKGNWGGNTMLLVLQIPRIEELQHLNWFCFWAGEDFIKSKEITKKPLQKRWRLDQSASAFHTHHSKSPRRSIWLGTGWNPSQSQWEAILMFSKVECKPQLCGALKIYLLLLISLFWKGG